MKNAKICPNCQTENPAEANFCRHCGKPFVATANSARRIERNQLSKDCSQLNKMQGASKQYTSNELCSQRRLQQSAGSKPKGHTAVDLNLLFWWIFFRLLAFSISFVLCLYISSIEGKPAWWEFIGWGVLSSWIYGLLALVIVEIFGKKESLDRTKKEIPAAYLYPFYGAAASGIVVYWLL